MASVNVTVTIQAAGDSIMTEDNASGTALTDDDCRKVYGLPHTFVASGAMREKVGGNVIGSYRFVMNDRPSMVSGNLNEHGGSGARWDEISPADNFMTGDVRYESSYFTGIELGGYGQNDVSITNLKAFTGGYRIDRRPATTAFQLKADTLDHQVADMSAVTPLPGTDWGQSGVGDSGTPEQLDNFAFGVGLRQETLTLGGVFVDRGMVSAANPRRQILLNIARTQYLKIRNAGAPPTAAEQQEAEEAGTTLDRSMEAQWGGRFAGPLNPRSYPCLTIFNQNLDDQFAGAISSPPAETTSTRTRGDVEPDGAYKVYRGIIQSLSFTAEGGRPDFWRWQLTFKVIVNEKRGLGLLGDEVNMAGSDGEDAGP